MASTVGRAPLFKSNERTGPATIATSDSFSSLALFWPVNVRVMRPLESWLSVCAGSGRARQSCGLVGNKWLRSRQMPRLTSRRLRF